LRFITVGATQGIFRKGAKQYDEPANNSVEKLKSQFDIHLLVAILPT